VGLDHSEGADTALGHGHEPRSRGRGELQQLDLVPHLSRERTGNVTKRDPSVSDPEVPESEPAPTEEGGQTLCSSCSIGCRTTPASSTRATIPTRCGRMGRQCSCARRGRDSEMSRRPRRPKSVAPLVVVLAGPGLETRSGAKRAIPMAASGSAHHPAHGGVQDQSGEQDRRQIEQTSVSVESATSVRLSIARPTRRFMTPRTGITMSETERTTHAEASGVPVSCRRSRALSLSRRASSV
jgi:hypothetical protein